MQFIANPSRTERVEKEGSSLYDPQWLALSLSLSSLACTQPEVGLATYSTPAGALVAIGLETGDLMRPGSAPALSFFLSPGLAARV